MRGASLLWVLVAGPVAAQRPVPTVTPRAGLVITTSVRLVPGTYRFAAPGSLLRQPSPFAGTTSPWMPAV